MSHKLTEYLSIYKTDPRGFSISEIEKMLPDGWNKQFVQLIQGIQTILNRRIITVAIRNGVLYISQSTSDTSNTSSTLADFVITTLSQRSTKTCMMCGQFARRRKEQAHKPALCRDHYIEYINAIED